MSLVASRASDVVIGDVIEQRLTIHGNASLVSVKVEG